MNFPEITALAREYAEWITDVPKANELPNCLMNEAHTLIAENAECMLQWLLRRFCLVEKERVKNEYNKTLEEAKLAHPKHQIQSRTRMRLLKSLFPELAKEVENEHKF